MTKYEIPSKITDEFILSFDTVPMPVACKYLGKSKDFISLGLQHQVLPFGTAVKGKGSVYKYDIRPEALVDYKHNGNKNIINDTVNFMADAVVAAFNAKLRGATHSIDA